MKPPRFEYHAPTSIGEALELLSKYGAEAKVLAGGQSLMPLLNFRLSTPTALIDINRIEGLSYIREEKGWLALGAMTRERTVEWSSLARERAPLLVEATRLIGHPPIRTRGTIGGSIAHADPAAEYPLVATVLGAELVVRSSAGERRVWAEDFFAGPLTTVMNAEELLVEVRIGTTSPDCGWSFEEFAPRRGDFAIAGVAALIVAEAGRCKVARLGACGVGGTPIRLGAAEEALEQDGLDASAVEEASRRAAAAVEPTSDVHASADYRRYLVGVLTRRAIERAAQRSQERAAKG
jgi:carbon-monoxide dehydrogenase medium subunit